MPETYWLNEGRLRDETAQIAIEEDSIVRNHLVLASFIIGMSARLISYILPMLPADQGYLRECP